jgi:hypothetical protein
MPQPSRLERLPAGPASAGEFAAYQVSVIGFSSPVARLERDDIYVLRNVASKIVGGIVVGTRSPFRALETLAPADREALESTLDLDDMVELYGAVLSPEVRSRWQSTAFWFAAMRAIQGHGKRTMLGSTVEDGLRKLYASAGGKLIRESAITFNGRTCEASVFTWNVRSMALDFIAGAMRRQWNKMKRAARAAIAAPVVMEQAPAVKKAR